MSESNPKLCINELDDVSNTCSLALTSKGYRLSLVFNRLANNEIKGAFEAEKDGRRFRADSELELLGLVAMWEERGDDWRTHPDEVQFMYELLYRNSVIRELECV